MENRFIGQNTVRPDGKAKVSGAAKYAADYSMDGMLYAAVARAEIAHGRILKVHTEEAEKTALVYTAADLNDNVIVDIINDQPVLASEKVRFMGEPIAVVAAETREKAVYAASLVKAEYEALPVNLDAKEALSEAASPVHEGGNLVGTFENTKGDPEAAFAACDLVLERTFTTPYQEHAYMEPDANFSYMEGEQLTVISASQNVFHDQRMICNALGIEPEKVRVVSATVGGAFGGKDGHMTQIFGALVTWKTGRPVKIVFDRQESIAYTYKRHSTELHVKIGFDKNGRILAFDADNVIDTGAYIGYGLSVLGLLSEHIPGPYNIDNVHVRSRLAYTNKTPASAFRGFGAPQANFATESLISEAADILKLDPLKMRRLNALRQGDTGALGQPIDHSCGLAEALDMMEKTPLWQEKLTNTDPWTGYGLAAGHLSCGFGKSIPDQAEITLEKRADGKFLIRIGLTEIGQGGVNSLTAIAADALSVTPEEIVMEMGDTAVTFDCGSTAASRSTFLGGNAILSAAAEYIKRAAAGEQDIKVRTAVPFPESPVITSPGVPHSMYTFVVQLVKVKIDPVSYKPTVTDACAITEAGKVINPMQLSGQVTGGMTQSIGLALGENCRYDADGRMLTDSFTTYLIPTFADAPSYVTDFVDGYEPSGPAGVKGAAESPTVPTAAAVNAAVHDAAGVWHQALPISGETIFAKRKELGR